MNDKLTPSRRNFLKTAFAASVVATCGTSAIAKILPDLKEIDGSILGVYNVVLATFPSLANVGGSVVITIPKATGAARKMVVTRTSADAFIAVSALCTHQGVTVEPYNPSTKQIVCLQHGSVFAIDGKLVSGPASSNLTKYITTYAAGDTSVGIEVPGLVGVDEEFENRFSLENSPNPATDQTMIRFTLERESNVVLKIMNTQGQEIATLLDEKLSTGNHNIPFKTNTLAAGVYYYQITANGFSQTKQLTVVR
ncbi:MAG: T9SS type A sorting domain-containing protein [Bacteroidota bacterium]